MATKTGNPFIGLSKEEVEELSAQITQQNRETWAYGDSIGGEEGQKIKEKAHADEVEHRAKRDAITGEHHIYDGLKGTWTDISESKDYHKDDLGGYNIEKRNEKPFSYDVKKDPLYKQFLEQYKRNGQDVMSDVMAKSAAQTGGIVSSYGVSAAAGAYNDYMEGANDIIPQLENIAYQRYQDNLAREEKQRALRETEKQEEATVSTILSNYGSYGLPLSDSEKQILFANGYSIDGDGETIVGPSGERLKAGSEYKDEQMETILANYMLGNSLSASDILAMEEAGYIYANGILYSPSGEAVDKRYMAQSMGLPSDLLAAYNGLLQAQKNGKQLGSEYVKTLSDYGFIYDSKTNNWVERTTGQPISSFFEDAGVDYSGNVKDVKKGKEPLLRGVKNTFSNMSGGIVKEGENLPVDLSKYTNQIEAFLISGDYERIEPYVEGLVEEGELTEQEAIELIEKYYDIPYKEE